MKLKYLSKRGHLMFLYIIKLSKTDDLFCMIIMLNKYANSSFRMKTQQAIIENINQHEALHPDYKLKLSDIRDQIIKKHLFRVLISEEWKKIQLFPDTPELYQLTHSGKEQTDILLKIIIKNFTGTSLYLSLSTRPELTISQPWDYKIGGEKIIKINNPILRHNQTYLTLHSPNDLVIFKIKYQFLINENNSGRQNSLKLNRLNKREKSEQTIFFDSEKLIKRISSLKKIRNLDASSPRSIVVDQSRIESGRLDFFVKQKQRMELARQKKVNVQMYRQKSKSLKVLSHECSTILKQYKSHVQQSGQKRMNLLRNLVRLIEGTIFVRKVHHRTKERQSEQRRIVLATATLKRCARKFKNITQELTKTIPKLQIRQLLVVVHNTALFGRTLIFESKKKAKKVVQTCLLMCFVGLSSRKLFECCSQYRRKIKTIQRYWLGRNKAQMSMFMLFLQNEMNLLFDSNISLGLVKQQFKQKNMFHNLSWQYLKESSQKINSIFNGYKLKLEQIEDTKKINIETQKTNAKAMRKNIKPLLQIPQTPSYPTLRYFRDIDILKTMLRSWLEIQYRKEVRKMKTEKVSAEKKKKNPK